MGLLLEDEADCLNHQHKHRRHWPPIRRQSRAAAPYRASGLVRSALAVNGPLKRNGRFCIQTGHLLFDSENGWKGAGQHDHTVWMLMDLRLAGVGAVANCPIAHRSIFVITILEIFALLCAKIHFCDHIIGDTP